jgi:two-component system phosphate regulon response regulator OmpR
VRRTEIASGRKPLVSFGDYQFDVGQGKLLKQGAVFALTTGEGQLLKALAEKAGEPVARSELALVLGAGSSERSVDVQMSRLRKKIEEGGKPVYIQTVRGSGYVLYAE